MNKWNKKTGKKADFTELNEAMRKDLLNVGDKVTRLSIVAIPAMNLFGSLMSEIGPDIKNVHLVLTDKEKLESVLQDFLRYMVLGLVEIGQDNFELLKEDLSEFSTTFNASQFNKYGKENVE